MDYAALAAQYGGKTISAEPQPASAAPPWADNLSRKDLGGIQIKMYEEGRKRLGELETQIADAGHTIGALNEYGNLNRQNSTGSLWQQITPDKSLFRSGPSMEMAAITSRLAPAQRPTGSGSSSDRDVSMFLRSLPSLENDGNTNRGIREDFERQYKSAIEKATAMRQHLDKYGNLLDFDSMWARQKLEAQAAEQAAKQAAEQNGKNSAISPGGWFAQRVGK